MIDYYHYYLVSVHKTQTKLIGIVREKRVTKEKELDE